MWDDTDAHICTVNQDSDARALPAKHGHTGLAATGASRERTGTSQAEGDNFSNFVSMELIKVQGMRMC